MAKSRRSKSYGLKKDASGRYTKGDRKTANFSGTSKYAGAYGLPTQADSNVYKIKSDGSKEVRDASGEFVPYTGTPEITSDILQPNTGITVPPPPPPGNLGTQTMTGLTGLVNANADKKPETPTDAPLKEYLRSLTKPPSAEDIYEKTEREVKLRQKEQVVNNLQAQLSAITSKAQADKLSLEGMGRGVTDVIIGGQQAKIDREAAIQSLPIAAQLSAAQDDLDGARDHLQTLFQIRLQDAQAKVDHKNKLAELVYNYANEQQKIALDDRREQDQRDFTLLRDNISYARDLAQTALENGQSSLAASIMKLDPNSSTYSSDLASYAGSLAQPASSGGSGGGTVEERKAQAVADLQFNIGSGQPLSDGTPTLDQNGFITPGAWNTLISYAPSQGLSREAFIREFGYLLYTINGKVDPSYKLTAAEQKLVFGALPE